MNYSVNAIVIQHSVVIITSGVTATMGWDRENPWAPNPNGGPQAQAIAYRATMNSVKSFPNVREMGFQRA